MAGLIIIFSVLLAIIVTLVWIIEEQWRHIDQLEAKARRER